MIISDDKKLNTVRQEFHELFPYLKIEFYKNSHEPGEGSPKTQRIDPDKTVGEVRTIHVEGDLKIVPEMSVGEFEKLVSDTYGLNVQVFRKSGNLWMQTTSTDDWSLNQQNRKGGSSEHAYQEKYEQ